MDDGVGMSMVMIMADGIVHAHKIGDSGAENLVKAHSINLH